MTTDTYRMLPGKTPAEKLGSLGFVPGKKIDLRELAAAVGTYGISVYLFFNEQLARNTSLELVIHQYRDVPAFERPYVRAEEFLRFVQENDPAFQQVMQADPVMVEIINVAEISANPAIPALVYITALMPYLDELGI
ncbi:MAG: hypothetical protein OS112_02880 [Methanoregula sp.]|nr:MAG: hypothetical protein OS112_02880 [Methanoregula sp.]